MQLITKKRVGCVHVEVWAQYDPTAEVYELFFDKEGQTYTGWYVDTISEALAAASTIIDEQRAAYYGT